MPARFRHGLPAAGDMRLVLAPALADRCLDVYPMEAWEQFEQKVARLPKWDRDTVLLRRRYVSAAVECDMYGRAYDPRFMPSVKVAHSIESGVCPWCLPWHLCQNALAGAWLRRQEGEKKE